MASNTGLPSIIQGGMGVAVSGWPLANAVARRGQLGVVSGTILEVVMARRLQLGDPGGHVRRALEQFPFASVSDRVLDAYFVPGGKDSTRPFKNVRTFTVDPDLALQELTVAANFVEVFLAKEGHDGPVGINYLRKIEIPIPFSVYGAMLAGVDYVIVGAGNPKDMPGMISRLARSEAVTLPLRVQGLTSSDDAVEIRFDPSDLNGSHLPVVDRPDFLAIVASVDLAEGLAQLPEPPDGFIVEAPSAGGHNAPPRGPRVTDDLGQPVYDERDDVDPARLVEIGLPFWLAGSFGTPQGLQQALAEGAAGVQVGTAFAFCEESGLTSELKETIVGQVADGTVEVRSDWRASPTGFPFRIVQVEGSISDEDVFLNRRRVCDLGALRVPYKTDNDLIGYRCPAEPLKAYGDVKGGRVQNTEGRACLCNGLLATAGLPQYRTAAGVEEPPIVTAGSDFEGVRALMDRKRDDGPFYSARDVIDYLAGVPA
ncbi:MAG: nitronate monooxygenase [Acidimicrobiia bacterium]|nr:nitronate monooxygenase [Acidimicrobiia bacterium]NNF87957.1 nitronate monooxygenase [Acidimicrobiia bacterium]